VVNGWQVAALAVEHGGQLATPPGHRLAGLSPGGGHVLEDQGGTVIGAPGRERADHAADQGLR
jgi:hypothetical protein